MKFVVMEIHCPLNNYVTYIYRLIAEAKTVIII